MAVFDHRAAAGPNVPYVNEAPNADAWPEHGHADPGKALVMAWIGALIRAGHAEWDMLGNGDIELRLTTGEVFRLSETTVTRVACGRERHQNPLTPNSKASFGVNRNDRSPRYHDKTDRRKTR